MKLYAVIDRITEADILVAVFSTELLAQSWIEKHISDRDRGNSRFRAYECLDVQEVELDPQ